MITNEIIKYLTTEITNKLNRIGLRLEREIIKVLDENKKNVTGDLKKSIHYNIKIFNNIFTVEVGSNIGYAYYVHEGRKAGKMPPITKIRDYVLKKGITPVLRYKTMKDYQAVTTVAFLIAQSIAKKGTKGLKFLDIALKKAETDIIKILEG